MDLQGRSSPLFFPKRGSVVEKEVITVEDLLTGKFWKILRVVSWVWISLAIFYLHYALLRTLRLIFSDYEVDVWLIGNLSVFSGSALTLDYLLVRRRLFSEVFSSAVSLVDKYVPDPAKVLTKWKVYVSVTITYVVFMMFVTVGMSQVKCRASNPYSVFWVSTMLFGVDCTQFSNQTMCFLCGFDNFFSGWSLLGCCPFLALGVFILSSTVTHCVDAFNNYLDECQRSTMDLRLLKDIRYRHNDIIKTMDRVNESLKYLILLWLSLGVESACFSITVCIQRYGSQKFETIGSSLYYVAKYGQPALVIIAVTLIASSVTDSSAKCHKKFQSLVISAEHGSTLVADNGNDYHCELLLLSDQLRWCEIGFSAGGCFLLTKKFSMSCLGLGLTYVIVLLQFEKQV